MVRAKFRCQSVEKSVEGETLKMMPVTSSGDDPNKSWSTWTPSGSLQMYVTNPECFGKFEPGKCYFLDFTPAE